MNVNKDHMDELRTMMEASTNVWARTGKGPQTCPEGLKRTWQSGSYIMKEEKGLIQQTQQGEGKQDQKNNTYKGHLQSDGNLCDSTLLTIQCSTTMEKFWL